MFAGAGLEEYLASAMGMGRKLALGVLTLSPLVALVVAIYALSEQGDGSGLFLGMIVLSGLLDSAVAAFLIPHVHDNRRLGNAARLVWIVLLGIPYITVAPLYWAIYMLPEKREDRIAAQEAATAGGAWYADPWGEAPYRWWDGNGWTDWVTGPPRG